MSKALKRTHNGGLCESQRSAERQQRRNGTRRVSSSRCVVKRCGRTSPPQSSRGRPRERQWLARLDRAPGAVQSLRLRLSRIALRARPLAFGSVELRYCVGVIMSASGARLRFRSGAAMLPPTASFARLQPEKASVLAVLRRRVPPAPARGALLFAPLHAPPCHLPAMPCRHEERTSNGFAPARGVNGFAWLHQRERCPASPIAIRFQRFTASAPSSRAAGTAVPTFHVGVGGGRLGR